MNCKQCGQFVPQVKGGRKRRYCSSRCKQKRYRIRLAEGTHGRRPYTAEDLMKMGLTEFERVANEILRGGANYKDKKGIVHRLLAMRQQ